jgi:hypothetical protein
VAKLVLMQLFRKLFFLENLKDAFSLLHLELTNLYHLKGHLVSDLTLRC